MCGIAGIVGAGSSERSVQAMIDTLVHRGPDGCGVWSAKEFPVTLGHRRLAIVDLSPTGHQPMTHQNGRKTITYNGELYNTAELQNQLKTAGYQFRGTSDTEVLLSAFDHWGTDAFRRLNGMFALAIVDEDKGQLYLARDRCGQKPLFFTHGDNQFAFASEIKAL